MGSCRTCEAIAEAVAELTTGLALFGAVMTTDINAAVRTLQSKGFDYPDHKLAQEIRDGVDRVQHQRQSGKR